MQFPTNARSFQASDLLQISMPMGGIGAGCICLAGHGALQDVSIRNKPATTALADTITGPTDTGFALLHVRGDKPVTKLLEGPLSPEKAFDQGLQSMGYRKGGYEGLPRFQNCSFHSAYPTGQVELSDDTIPVAATITGWSPFIPLDDRTSSMPCAIVEYTLLNTGNSGVEFDFTYHLSHLPRANGGWRMTRNKPIDGGILFYNTVPEKDETFGSATVTVIGHAPKIKAMWLRGAWFDWIASIWDEASRGVFSPNDGNTDRPIDGHNGGSILVQGKLAPGESMTIPVVITWHVPNVYMTQQQPGVPPWYLNVPPVSNVPPDKGPAWRPYYAGQWGDAAAVAADVRNNFDDIRRKTMSFRDALFSSTLPADAMDAVASNLAILKSPTVLREENGNIWAWEGCFTVGGCCPGSCTHVWNYTQAMPHLFPALERTLREQELPAFHATQEGHVDFRAALARRAFAPRFLRGAASDGQLGGILKLYRDYGISAATDAWLARPVPAAPSAAWTTASRRVGPATHKGMLFEPHHNTYDIEFWGADGMCTSIYIGAPCAAMSPDGPRRRPNDQEGDPYARTGRCKGAKLIAIRNSVQRRVLPAAGDVARVGRQDVRQAD